MSKVVFRIEVDPSDTYSLNQLRREYARIRAYDGKTVTVTFEIEEPQMPSLIVPPASLHDVLKGALSAADAAASRWYRKNPVGKPYEVRVNAATDSVREEFDSMFRALDKHSGMKVYTNRRDYIAANFTAIEKKFGSSRGPVETSFRRILADQKGNGRD